MGAEAILRQDPHARPNQTKKSPAPAYHAATKAARESFWESYSAFVAAFREAAEKLKAGDRTARFPVGSFPPALRERLPEPAAVGGAATILTLSFTGNRPSRARDREGRGEDRPRDREGGPPEGGGSLQDHAQEADGEGIPWKRAARRWRRAR